uniref:Uncharacterized protein n=1 Tax=Chromera velia CCMP2878 TaxID=1169474 RepID=A0A0G4I7I8_9ALVE|eukprot:Cvel_11647.t1-p1 / transcript=Cvel_11647.t1 / gene=Cvel_11647 / organism=Chromera_velia_CCMP2878 / gene_product=Uncharacterized WD repeat-containing protein, putative / transcript_product=Uncharacterized WD repeat-containing protein, putative / location=Cvel_scaffold738:6883-20172(-) / protein_length=910 / sequence_SO=supercontig / SO=protein_coding / is_pseudo=false
MTDQEAEEFFDCEDADDQEESQEVRRAVGVATPSTGPLPRPQSGQQQQQQQQQLPGWMLEKVHSSDESLEHTTDPAEVCGIPTLRWRDSIDISEIHERATQALNVAESDLANKFTQSRMRIGGRSDIREATGGSERTTGERAHPLRTRTEAAIPPVPISVNPPPEAASGPAVGRHSLPTNLMQLSERHRQEEGGSSPSRNGKSAAEAREGAKGVGEGGEDGGARGSSEGSSECDGKSLMGMGDGVHARGMNEHEVIVRDLDTGERRRLSTDQLDERNSVFDMLGPRDGDIPFAGAPEGATESAEAGPGGQRFGERVGNVFNRVFHRGGPGAQAGQEEAVPGSRRGSAIGSGGNFGSQASQTSSSSPRRGGQGGAGGGRRWTTGKGGVHPLYCVSRANVKRFKEWSSVWQAQELDPGNGAIWTLAFNPTGEFLAAGTDDGYILVWANECERRGDAIADPGRQDKIFPLNLFGEEPVWSVRGHGAGGKDARVITVRWHPNADLRQLLSTGMDGHVCLWILEAEGELPIRVAAIAHRDVVTSAIFTLAPDLFITGSWGGELEVWEYNAERGRAIIRSAQRLPQNITALSLSPNGELLCVGNIVGSVQFRDAQSDDLRYMTTIDCKNKAGKFARGMKVTGFSWKRDSSCVFVSTADSRIRMIDTADFGSDMPKSKGHNDGNTMLHASLDPSEGLLVSGCVSGCVFGWNTVDPLGEGARSWKKGGRKRTNDCWESFRAFANNEVVTAVAVAPEPLCSNAFSAVERRRLLLRRLAEVTAPPGQPAGGAAGSFQQGAARQAPASALAGGVGAQNGEREGFGKRFASFFQQRRQSEAQHPIAAQEAAAAASGASRRSFGAGAVLCPSLSGDADGIGTEDQWPQSQRERTRQPLHTVVVAASRTGKLRVFINVGPPVKV